MKRQHILILLCLVLAAAVIYAFLATPAQERVTTSSREVGRSVRPVEHKGKVKESLRLELLDRSDSEFESIARDIFNFYTPPPPPPPPAPVVKKPLPAPPPPVIKKPPVQVAPQPQLARFTFLGLLDIEDQVTVFLASGDNLFIVKNGEAFGEKDEFLVEDISADEVHISQKDQSGLIRVSLREKEKKPGEVQSPANGAGLNERSTRRRVPPVNRPQFRSYKKYEP